MGRYLTSGPWIFHGSSSILAGSAIGVPGPVATMRPPCTWRLSTADGGRYSPTLVRSSPSSGAISTRSPTTIKRFGSSGMSDEYPRTGIFRKSHAHGDLHHPPFLDLSGPVYNNVPAARFVANA